MNRSDIVEELLLLIVLCGSVIAVIVKLAMLSCLSGHRIALVPFKVGIFNGTRVTVIASNFRGDTDLILNGMETRTTTDKVIILLRNTVSRVTKQSAMCLFVALFFTHRTFLERTWNEQIYNHTRPHSHTDI